MDIYDTDAGGVQSGPENNFQGLTWRLLEQDATFLRAVGEYLISTPAVDGTPFDRGRLRLLMVRLPLPSPTDRAAAEAHHRESAERNGRPPCRQFIVAAMVAVLTEYFGEVDGL